MYSLLAAADGKKGFGVTVFGFCLLNSRRGAEAAERSFFLLLYSAISAPLRENFKEAKLLRI